MKKQVFIEKCEKALKAAGQRVTKSRRSIAAAMAHEGEAFSASDIYEQVSDQKSGKLELSTVYRSMEAFLDLGLIHAVQNEHGKFVVCQSQDVLCASMHILLNCKVCGGFDEEIVPLKEASLSSLVKNRGFSAHKATVDVFGECSACV